MLLHYAIDNDLASTGWLRMPPPQYCMQHFFIPLAHHKCITIPMIFLCRACLLLYAILKWHALLEHSYAQFMLQGALRCPQKLLTLPFSLLSLFPSDILRFWCANEHCDVCAS